MAAARWKLQLARRTTVLHRERETFRPMQYSSIVRAPITASAARRARAASLRVLPPPERQPAQWRARACHVKAGCELEATVRTSHHGLAPKEIGLPKVQYPFMACMPIQPARHGTRARQVRVFRHLPRHSQRSGARASVTRKPAVRWRSQLARRTTVLHGRREASRRCSAIPSCVVR